MVLRGALMGMAGCMALALGGAPALADVKAGVDAWGRGDYTRAVKEWQAPAAKGDADAQFNLAQAYRLGRGVPENLAKAEALYAQAADQGHIKAADNYGLLLFQSGRWREAMPFVTAASERGDPRAQYLLGIAHFNGDLAAKDWVRAYALLTLANAAGLPQAAPALKQMDEFIPMEQRQQAQSLAGQLKHDSDAQRASQLAAADLATGPGSTFLPAAPIGRVAATPAAVAAPSVVTAQAAVAEAMRATGTESPASTGADYTRSAAAPAPPAPRPVERSPAPVTAARIAAAPPATAQGGADGPWKVQLGAFSVDGSAEKLWSRIGGKGALAGKNRILQPAGRLTKLLAGGWGSQGAAQQACSALKASGQDCIVTR